MFSCFAALIAVCFVCCLFALIFGRGTAAVAASESCCVLLFASLLACGFMLACLVLCLLTYCLFVLIVWRATPWPPLSKRFDCLLACVFLLLSCLLGCLLLFCCSVLCSCLDYWEGAAAVHAFALCCLFWFAL